MTELAVPRSRPQAGDRPMNADSARADLAFMRALVEPDDRLAEAVRRNLHGRRRCAIASRCCCTPPARGPGTRRRAVGPGGRLRSDRGLSWPC